MTYPWGPKRPRYPYRAARVNAAGLVLARGAEAMGIDWVQTPLATVSAPRGLSPALRLSRILHRGCSTNAKQSALITWIPRAVRAGAEIRDLAMVGRDRDRATTGRAPACIICGRAMALPGAAQRRGRRLRDRDAAPAADLGRCRFPDGLANSSGLVGRNLMVQTNQAVWGAMEEEVRWYKGRPRSR